MSALPAGINFDGIGESFAQYDATLRGYARYEVVHRHLEPYLPRTSLRILDVGGGNGPDTAWLAVMGHEVTMVEDSAEQCAYAERRFNYFLNAEERARITTVQGQLKDVKPSDDTFDVVLVHCVAMYQPQPARLIKQAIARVKPGGVFSLLEKGYYGAEARAIRDMDEDDFESLHQNRHIINHLKRKVSAFKPEELALLLTTNELEVLEWSGVRLITDEMYYRITDLDVTTLQRIVETEYQQGVNPEIRAQGQLLHFIARKP